MVADCLSSMNSGAGILALSRGSRLDGNHLSGNGLGLEVSGQEHLVVRNSLSKNDILWLLPPGNVSGGLRDKLSLEERFKVLGEAAGSEPDTDLMMKLLFMSPWTNIEH